MFFEHGSLEATTDFIVGAPEDRLLVDRPDLPTEHVDLVSLRDDYFVGLGLDRRDFLFYCYAADRNWVRCVQRREPALPGFTDALVAHQLVDAAYRSEQAAFPLCPGAHKYRCRTLRPGSDPSDNHRPGALFDRYRGVDPPWQPRNRRLRGRRLRRPLVQRGLLA